MKDGKSWPLCGLHSQWAALAVFLFLFAVAPSWGVLGGDTASIQKDQAHFQASLRRLPGNSYSIQELRGTAGNLIREYVSAQGTVFGVAWEGPWPPDLQQLLGSYFDEYTRAVQSSGAARPGRKPIRIDLPDLSVHTAGHPRSFTGQAYLPGMLPEGVSAEDIR